MRVAADGPGLLLRLHGAPPHRAARHRDVAQPVAPKRGARPARVHPAERAAGHVAHGRAPAAPAGRVGRRRRPVGRPQRDEAGHRGVRPLRAFGAVALRAAAARAADERAAQPAAGRVAQQVDLVGARGLLRGEDGARHVLQVPGRGVPVVGRGRACWHVFLKEKEGGDCVGGRFWADAASVRPSHLDETALKTRHQSAAQQLTARAHMPPLPRCGSGHHSPCVTRMRRQRAAPHAERQEAAGHVEPSFAFQGEHLNMPAPFAQLRRQPLGGRSERRRIVGEVVAKACGPRQQGGSAFAGEFSAAAASQLRGAVTHPRIALDTHA